MRKQYIRNKMLQAQAVCLILVMGSRLCSAQENLGSVEELRPIGTGGFGSKNENLHIKTFAKNILYRKSDTVLSSTALASLRPVILGVDIPGFCEAGEQIWEARFAALDAPEDTIHAMIWVDEDAERGLGIIGSWEMFPRMVDTLNKADRVTYEQEELTIAGHEAVALVFDNMQGRLGSRYDTNELVGGALMWEMGHSVPEFCNLKDIVWEVRVEHKGSALAEKRAILGVALVNAVNGEIRWLFSPAINQELEILESERNH